MNFKYLVLYFIAISFSSASFALPRHNPVPGGLAVIELPGTEKPAKAFYNKKRLAIFTKDNQHFALVGLSLSTKPGNKHIELHWSNGKKDIRQFDVKDKTYEAQYLTIKNKRKVNPNEKDMTRIVKERKKKTKARTHYSSDPVKANFIIPVEGRVSSIFGLRRFFNEQPRRPHSGLDIAAPEGTPIKAVESGTVIEASDFFFSGNVVYIDHGQGLISMYAHMHSIAVEIGQKTNKGDIIGTVGQTGRVTGAHLHLGILANQTLIDPVLLLPDLNTLKKSAP